MIETFKPVVETYHAHKYNPIKRRLVKHTLKLAYCSCCGNVLNRYCDRNYCGYCGNNINWYRYGLGMRWRGRFVTSLRDYQKIQRRYIENGSMVKRL